MDVWLCAGLCRGVSEEVITLLTSVNNNKFTSNTKFMKICQTQSCRSRSNMGNPSGGTLLMNERVSGSAKRWQVNMNDTMQQQSEFRSNFKLFTFNAISSIIDFDSRYSIFNRMKLMGIRVERWKRGLNRFIRWSVWRYPPHFTIALSVRRKRVYRMPVCTNDPLNAGIETQLFFLSLSFGRQNSAIDGIKMWNNID